MTDIQLHSLLMEITNPTLEITLLDIFLLPVIAFSILTIAGLFSSPKVKHSLATLALATFPIYFAFYFLSDFRKSEHIKKKQRDSIEIFYCVAEGRKILDSREGTTWEAQIADKKNQESLL